MKRLKGWVFPLAVALGAVPLWLTDVLPMVDLPQHLHLISVLHRIDDPTTLYPQVFAVRGGFTPYLGYYHVVSLLNWLLPLELANRVFLTVSVVALPLSVAYLLEALERPTWPSLLAIPFAYGDSFGWGFLNYLASIPLALFACGTFVHAIADPTRRQRHRWAIMSGVLVFAVLAFHAQTFAFLALALPFLLVTTRAPEDIEAGKPVWRARIPVVTAMLPVATLSLVWALGRLGRPAEIAYGEPWKAWGPPFSPQNLAVKPFAQNLHELFAFASNLLRDGSDVWPVRAAFAVALVGCALAWLPKYRGGIRVKGVGAYRIAGLGVIALALFFALPFDIRGYIYYLNTRYLHLAWPLLLAALPVARVDLREKLVLAGAGVALLTAVILGRGFARFDSEAAALVRLRDAVTPHARVMGLIYAAGSRHVTHPVYLHSAADLARTAGGFANFSFASTPHSPLRFRGAAPPTFPSEWRPQDFDFARHGTAYDHFLLRGANAGQVFGARLDGEFRVVAQSGDFTLIRRN